MRALLLERLTKQTSLAATYASSSGGGGGGGGGVGSSASAGGGKQLIVGELAFVRRCVAALLSLERCASLCAADVQSIDLDSVVEVCVVASHAECAAFFADGDVALNEQTEARVLSGHTAFPYLLC